MAKKKEKRELACFRPGKYQGPANEEFEILITEDFSILRINSQDYFFRSDNGSFCGVGLKDREHK